MTALRFESLLPVAPELVYHAFTHTDRVTQWFAPAATLEARVGGPFELYFIPGNTESMCTKGCTFTALEPYTKVGFTWRPPDEFLPLMADPLTVVTVTLEPAEGGTRLTLVHDGFGEGEEWAKAVKWHQMAWDQVLGSLKGALESGKGNLCCAPE